MASADQRILYTEFMVGATHPSLADTLNRLVLIDHHQSGAHTAITRADLTNTDGTTLTVGMVVIQDVAVASSVKRTTAVNSVLPVYVVMESILNAATGRVAYGGFCTVLVQGNVAIGAYLGTSATTGRAASQGLTAGAGAFAIAETAYTGGAAGSVTARLLGGTPAGGAKVVTFTRDMTLASGTQAVTGVGFQPRGVTFIGYHGTTAFGSWGADDGTLGASIAANSGVSTNVLTTNRSIFLYTSSGATYDGRITAFGADGFTITWTKTGLPSGIATIIALCHR